MQYNSSRRGALRGLGAGLITAGLIGGRRAHAAGEATLTPPTARTLRDLADMLATMPRRRDFRTVPMILDGEEWWDAVALDAVLNYKSGPKQSWDHTDLGGPWLNVMRNSLNAQIWSFRHPDFLCVSATHGSAHLALYDQATWDKYQLAKIAGGNITGNTFIVLPAAAAHDTADFQAATAPSRRRTTASSRSSVVAWCSSPAITRSGNSRSGWWHQARTPIISAPMRLPPN